MVKQKNKPKNSLVVGILILAAFLLFIIVRKGAGKTIELQSNDQKATLTIPAGAIPKGIDKSSLSIEALTIPEKDKDDVIAYYKLSPAGINLSKPAEVKIELDMEEENLWVDEGKSFSPPLVVHIGDDGSFKELSEVKLDVDLTNGKLALSTEIDSFSSLVINSQSPLLISFATASFLDSFKVGESFDVEVNISNNPEQSEKITYTYYSNEDRVVYETFLQDDGILILLGEIRSPSYISPVEITSLPETATILPGTNEAVTQTASLTCDNEGPRDDILFREEVDYTVHINGTVIATKKEIHYKDGRIVEVEMTEREFRAGYAQTVVSMGMEIICAPDNVEVTMLIYDGQEFPAVQFDQSDPDFCASDHYHPLAGKIAYNRQKQAVTDSAPKRCGFGTVASTSIDIVQMPRSEAQELSDFLESNGKPPIPIP